MDASLSCAHYVRAEAERRGLCLHRHEERLDTDEVHSMPDATAFIRR
jgi:hypothetical protein